MIRLLLFGLIVGAVYGAAQIGATQFDAKMDPEERQLLQQAAKFSGRAVPRYARPTVVYVSADTMALLLCNGDPECPIEGVYVGEQYVYVRAGLPEVHRRSVIVHEFVHWLQAQDPNRPKPSCARRASDEAEAYRVQNLYLKLVEHNTDFSFPPLVFCGGG
jgi:hypothetical protein